MAAFSSSSHDVNFSRGLLLKPPSLFSKESIFSQPLYCIGVTFLLSSKCRSPSLPGFGKLASDDNVPFSRSSKMLATYHLSNGVIKRVNTTCKLMQKFNSSIDCLQWDIQTELLMKAFLISYIKAHNFFSRCKTYSFLSTVEVCSNNPSWSSLQPPTNIQAIFNLCRNSWIIT